MLRALCGAWLLSAAALAAGSTGPSLGAGGERLRAIRGITFPAEQCYRVRDVFLEREDFKLHFSDGYILMAAPVEGRVFAALFLAATDTGEGEIILMPPTASERQSLARFVDAPVLDENIRTAMMFFTDDTGEVLRRLIAENPFNHADPEAGKQLTRDWQPVARNMIGGYETRMVMDSFLAGPSPGFFAATISGAKLGRFDILLDPRRSEQISVGQVVWQEGQRFYDVWTSFPAASVRRPGGKARAAPDLGALEHYRIEATLAPNLDMRVTTRATLVAGSTPERAIAFELSAQMKVTRLLVDGRPVECLQNEALDSSATRRRGNDWLLAVLDQPLEPGSRHEVEFQHEGNVIADAGHGVYFVGARGSWYPSHGLHFTDFDLLFRCPRRLQLVATGRPVENRVEGDERITRWKPERPIRIAGFNLGNFEQATLDLGDYTVEVCANRNLEAALEPPLAPLPPGPPARRPTIRNAPVPAAPMQEERPSPTRRLDEVAHDSAEAVEFFARRFGPPPLRHLTVSPIPGSFGQGFPGLIYLSTLSYYQPGDKPLEKLSSGARMFYAEQLRAHEIAHQWWGNLVTARDYHDEWLIESLADYSALLFLEQHKGAQALEAALQGYKNNLLAKSESGETVESAGAIVLGERLRSSRSPKAHYVIIYEKGAWVLHMLRRRMGDEKFFTMLRELREKYEYKAVTTEEFRELAARFAGSAPDPQLEAFFSQWVYSTGIPTLQMHYRITGKAGGKAQRYELTGTVKQSGVPEDFSLSAPIEIQLPGRAKSIETRVQTAGGETSFSLPLPQRPARVALDPGNSLLAVKQ
ncbi:MAG TPA: M1 family aminopeptidase [Bryobacterales bacterium]|nr:M1 family aminopeptidase [Bryobacterales bacterium]